MPDEIKRVKLHKVKCPKCKANLMVRPTEKVCPVCGNTLLKPKEPQEKAHILWLNKFQPKFRLRDVI
jgi:rRNA maturation endonuclease Nob1